MIKTTKCLQALVTPESRMYLRLYRHYQNGVLFNDLMDQPNKYLEAMEIIDAAK